MKYNVSAAHVLDVAEDLDGGPDIIPALDLGGDDDVDHLETCEHESEHDQVKQVEEDDVEGPTHHIVIRIEDVEDHHAHSHHKVHCETDEVADGISTSHVSVDFLESLVDFLCLNACNKLP